jgi:hypothetical protein
MKQLLVAITALAVLGITNPARAQHSITIDATHWDGILSTGAEEWRVHPTISGWGLQPPNWPVTNNDVPAGNYGFRADYDASNSYGTEVTFTVQADGTIANIDPAESATGEGTSTLTLTPGKFEYVSDHGDYNWAGRGGLWFRNGQPTLTYSILPQSAAGAPFKFGYYGGQCGSSGKWAWTGCCTTWIL